MTGTEAEARDWPRAAGLFVLALVLSVVQPLVLVAIPFALLALAVPVRVGWAVGGAGLALFLAMGGADSGIWYLERGWAILAGGWFAVLARFWPREGFLPRGLGAVGGAGAAATLFFAVWPDGWRIADWIVTERIVAGSAAAVEAIRLLAPDEAGSGAVMETMRLAAEFQGMVFPALLGLSTLAALGVAWWLHHRWVRGEPGGLGPVSEFRFHDQLVWILIGGLALFLLSDVEAWNRVGANTLVFMGGLYALRGWGVFLALMGGLTWLGYLAVALGLVLAAPFLGAAALALGVGDTWFDLRARYGAAGGGPMGGGNRSDHGA